ncbi:MAG: hypothetical protein H7X76_06695 [Prolixibacteraceae bacterium]|nr:hypothetical protein [Burkholderiales bacterium]
MKRFTAILVFSLCSASLIADTPAQILQRVWRNRKTRTSPVFSAGHGHELYFQKRVQPVVGVINCASCPTTDPREQIIAHQAKVLCRQCHRSELPYKPSAVGQISRLY